MKNRNLTPLAQHILDIINEYPKGCTRRFIAEQLGRKQSTLTNDNTILDKLVAKGYLTAEMEPVKGYKMQWVYRKR